MLVDEWLESDKNFHIVRDHKDHRMAIMAGCFGVRNGICKPYMLTFLRYYDQTTDHEKRTNQVMYTVDQNFLQFHIYPNIVERSFIHASHNGWEKHAKNIEWPEIGYCGEIIFETPKASKIMGDPTSCFERIRCIEK